MSDGRVRVPRYAPSDLLSPELTSVGLSAHSAEEVLRIMGASLVAHGYARNSLLEALLQREAAFPTGLPTAIGVAIPHADPEHVLKPAIAVATLAHPVWFREMGRSEARVSVEIVFLLAIDDAKRMAPILAQLTTVFQNARTLQALRAASSPDELCRMVRRALTQDERTDSTENSSPRGGTQ